MSITFTAPSSAHGLTRQLWDGLLTRSKRLWAAYDAWRVERAAVDALQSLTDRELKDIGLTRGEIVHAARGMAVAGRDANPDWHARGAQTGPSRPSGRTAGGRELPQRL